MRERVMKWLQIKRYNWKNYDIFLIAVVLILTFISSYVISIVNSDISLKRQLVGVVMGIVIIGIFSIIDYHDLCTDTLVEVEVTPNRPDLLSHNGMAYELRLYLRPGVQARFH